MKKELLLILFFSVFLNINASSTHHRHSDKTYIHKEFHHPSDITPKKSRKLEKLRLDFIKEDRSLTREIRSLRREMNHCLLEEREPHKYEQLRERMLSLKKDQRELKKTFISAYSGILHD